MKLDLFLLNCTELHPLYYMELMEQVGHHKKRNYSIENFSIMRMHIAVKIISACSCLTFCLVLSLYLAMSLILMINALKEKIYIYEFI